MKIFAIDTGCGVSRPTCGLAVLDTALSSRWPEILRVATLRREDVLAFPLADIDLVAIETPEGYAHGPRARAKVAPLLRCADFGGELAGIARAAGAPVIRAAAPAVRAALGVQASRRRRPGEPTVDARIAAALRLRFGTLPRCSVHARDALALALYADQRARLALAAGHGPACSFGRSGAPWDGSCAPDCPRRAEGSGERSRIR